MTITIDLFSLALGFGLGIAGFALFFIFVVSTAPWR